MISLNTCLRFFHTLNVLATVGGGGGWSGGAAKVLGKLSAPGRPTYLENNRAKAYCACSRCGWGLFGHFFSLVYLFSLLSPSLRDGPI